MLSRRDYRTFDFLFYGAEMRILNYQVCGRWYCTSTVQRKLRPLLPPNKCTHSPGRRTALLPDSPSFFPAADAKLARVWGGC
jgi:hypothetical protein